MPGLLEEHRLAYADRGPVLVLRLREISKYKVTRFGRTSLKHDAHLVDLVHISRLVLLAGTLRAVRSRVGLLKTSAHRWALSILVQN